MVIEFAREVCGIATADHEETNPDAKDPIISKLSNSLIGQEEELTITDRGSILYGILQKEMFRGKYFCSYGFNEKYTNILQSSGLTVTARSVDQQVRAFEFKSHPFFMGTLFQPAMTSAEGEPDPIIVAFAKKCLTH